MRTILCKVLNSVANKEVDTDSVADELIKHYNNKVTIPLNLSERGKEVKSIDVNDICCVIKISNKATSVYTLNEKLFHLNKYIDLQEMLLKDFENFAIADKNTVVHLPKVRKYDSYFGDLFFGENVQNCLKVRVHLKFVNGIVKKWLGKENDVSEMKSLDQFWLKQAKQV